MVMAFDQFPRWCSRALGSLDHCSNGQLADLLESNVQLEQFIDDLPEVGTTGITSSSCAPGLLAYSESHVLNTLCDNVGFQVISKLRNGIPCRGRGGISDRPVAKGCLILASCLGNCTHIPHDLSRSAIIGESM